MLLLLVRIVSIFNIPNKIGRFRLPPNFPSIPETLGWSLSPQISLSRHVIVVPATMHAPDYQQQRIHFGKRFLLEGQKLGPAWWLIPRIVSGL